MKPCTIDTDYTPLFEHVLEQPYGVKIKTNNPKQMRWVLSEWKRGRVRYDTLMTEIPSIPGYVFITHKSVELS